MSSGIQAVSARIAMLQQRFDPSAASASASAEPLSATAFSSVLSSALGEAALRGASPDGAALGGTGAFGLTAATGNAATGGLSTAALLDLLVLAARQQGGAVGSGSSATTGVAGVSGTSARTPAARLAPGQYPKLTPPAELVAFGNGRIPADRLTPIGVGSHKLYAPAAQAYQAMVADAQAQGVTIGITDSYRSYESQVDLAGRKGLYSQGGLAATPGTSNHGWGLAVDLDLDATAQQWMRDNGWRYGFVEDTPREPWHWAYRPQSA